jgi:aspartate-semialdehyde dehydrogenase
VPSPDEPRVGVVGATGAVGRVTLRLLRERGYARVRAFASQRSAGSTVDGLEVEEATADSLGEGGLDLCLFSVGTDASAELVPAAAAGGALCVDKSSAFRLADGVPLVVPEVNGKRARENEGIVANPNCSTIPLTIALAPLLEAAGLRRVRVATYQAASGAGAEALERLRAEPSAAHDLRMDWSFDGEEFDEEAKIRAETRKILELPDLPVSATCVRVPILVGHSEAVWVETEDALSPEQAERILGTAPGIRLEPFPTPGLAALTEDVLVGRVRRDRAAENGLALFLSCDNLVKGAALNALQIAELLLGERSLAPTGRGQAEA